MMTTAEAKEIIKKDFMDGYHQFLTDVAELNDHDFGWKYGWQKSGRTSEVKDNIKGVTLYQKYFSKARTAEKMEQIFGIEKKVIWELVNEKWLSEQIGYWKNPSKYFVSQKLAKEIWRESR